MCVCESYLGVQCARAPIAQFYVSGSQASSTPMVDVKSECPDTGGEQMKHLESTSPGKSSSC